MANALTRFLVREDPVDDRYTERLQARSTGAKLGYLAMYLVPGILAWWLINAPGVHQRMLALTGLPGDQLQYLYLIVVTFGWHMALPVLVLRFADGLTLREAIEALGLARIDWKGLLVVLPVVFVAFSLLSLPYMKWIFPPVHAAIASVPALAIPEHSIFQGGKLYAFPPVMLFFLLVGNFVGEEVYFRGYLMKKTAFLGRHNWWIGSLLFAFYHFWQAEQTWTLAVPGLIFGAMMAWRKNLYVLIALHALLNLVWSAFVDAMLR